MMNKEKLLDTLLDFVRQLEGYEIFDNLSEYLCDFDDIDEQLTEALDHIKNFRKSLDRKNEMIDFFEGHGAAGVMFDNIPVTRSDAKMAVALDGIITLVEAALI